MFCLWVACNLLHHTDVRSLISSSIKWALDSTGYNLCLCPDWVVKLLNHYILNCVWKPIIYWTRCLVDGELMCIEALVHTVTPSWLLALLEALHMRSRKRTAFNNSWRTFIDRLVLWIVYLWINDALFLESVTIPVLQICSLCYVCLFGSANLPRV